MNFPPQGYFMKFEFSKNTLQTLDRVPSLSLVKRLIIFKELKKSFNPNRLLWMIAIAPKTSIGKTSNAKNFLKVEIDAFENQQIHLQTKITTNITISVLFAKKAVTDNAKVIAINAYSL